MRPHEGEESAAFRKRFVKRGRRVLAREGTVVSQVHLAASSHTATVGHVFAALDTGPSSAVALNRSTPSLQIRVGEAALLDTSGISECLASWLSVSPLSTVGNAHHWK